MDDDRIRKVVYLGEKDDDIIAYLETMREHFSPYIKRLIRKDMSNYRYEYEKPKQEIKKKPENEADQELRNAANNVFGMMGTQKDGK